MHQVLDSQGFRKHVADISGESNGSDFGDALGPSLIPVEYHEFGQVIWLLTNKISCLNQQGTRTSSLLVFVSFLFLTLSGSHLHYSA